MKALTTLFVVGMFLIPAALADDADDVKAAVLEFYEQLNNENPGYRTFYVAGGDQFPRTGSLLQQNQEISATSFADGLDFDVQVHHLNVKVHGNAAVATYYTTGTTTYPSGDVLRGIFRASITAVKQGNQWKFAHLHLSRLESEPGQ
jgi:hypothetical protein